MTITMKTDTFDFPWIGLVKNSYTMRLRVSNFDNVGRRCFSRIVSDAIGGERSFFIWQDGQPIPACYAATAMFEEDNIEDLLSKVSIIGMDGRCYDEEMNEVNGNLRCVSLTHPPVTTNATLLAGRAWNIETLISQNLEHLIMPEPVVSGTSPDVTIKADPTKNVTDWAKFDANDDHETIVRPEVKRLTQWNIDQLSTMLQMTARSFQMETGLPPQDTQILDVLSSTTQSLVSNRESFVSRTYIIKQELSAVFDSVGETLDFEMTFPATAQDIASIGDAYGKGLNEELLKRYQVV